MGNIGGLTGPVILGLYDKTEDGLRVLAYMLGVTAVLVAVCPKSFRGHGGGGGSRGEGGARDFTQLEDAGEEDDEQL